MNRLERLVSLFHRRWTVPVLAELERQGGAKFITLTSRTGASEGAMRETLEELMRRGWVCRNPGYGHPLRPEYILTPAGGRVSPRCVELDDTLESLGARAVALRKWSMPVLAAVGEGPARFRRIAEQLCWAGGAAEARRGITDRALSLALHELRSSSLVDRRLENNLEPPMPTYWGTDRGLRLVPILVRL